MVLELFYPRISNPYVSKEKERALQERRYQSVFSATESVKNYVYKKYQIGDLIPSPGHRFIYKNIPNKLELNYSKITINILLEEQLEYFKLIGVELWDGHHRLVEFMVGYGSQKTLYDYNTFRHNGKKESKIDFLINSIENNNNHQRPHWYNLNAFFLQNFKINYRIVNEYPFAKKYTIELSQNISNQELGVFYKLKDIKYFPEVATSRKIGLFFGTFDPIHNGHIDIIDFLLQGNYIDCLIIIPNANAENKNIYVSMKHRIQMIKFALTNQFKSFQNRLYLFLNNTEKVGDVKNREIFCESISQLFGVNIKCIYQIEGLEINKKIDNRHYGNFILLPRNWIYDESIRKIIHYSHSKIISEFHNRWNLSSSLIRAWLQIFFSSHPQLRNNDIEACLNISLPEKVFRYIKKEKLYHKLYPFIYLKSEILEEKCTKKIKIHDEKNNQNNLKCYLITIGVRERLKYFRKQIKNIPLHFTEDLGFNGKYINVIKIGEELYITYKNKFLEFSGGLIQTTLSRSIYSICLDNTFYYPMTNYEIGCYLSHISIWNKLIFSRAKNALVCEDRVIFYDNFYDTINKYLEQLEANKYDFCYLYNQAECGGFSLANSDDMLLTSYLISQGGALNLLKECFPIKQPIDWYIKTRATETKCFSLKEKIVGRNKNFPTTIPKFHHYF